MKRHLPSHRLSLVLAAALLVAGCSDQPVSPELDVRLQNVGCDFLDSCDPGGGGGDGSGPVAPETTITSSPPLLTTSTSATFTFSSNTTPVTFQCQLDGGALAECNSGTITYVVAVGTHVFSVFAVNGANIADASPATHEWTVLASEPPAACAPGSYLAGTTCVPAPAGSFVAVSGATSATPCAAGTYQPATGQTSCLLAPAGSFVAGTGATAATPCAAGTYQILQGQTSCMPAPAGSFVAGTGATATVACSPGTYQPATGQAVCLDAPLGNYVESFGAISATACPAGTTTLATRSTSASACIAQYTFTGFFAPVRNDVLNVVKAGRAVPISFSLGGDFGLDIFAAGHPASVRIVCDGGATEDEVEATTTAGSSGLSYDPTTQQYTYVWKTERSWGGTCRRLTLRLDDGTVRSVDFRLAN